jgi:hypothetical protein
MRIDDKRSEDTDRFRAVVSSLCVDAFGVVEPVHVNRLNRAAERYSCTTPSSVLIKDLVALGDIGSLDHGRYFPMPLRAVALSSYFLVLGCVPSGGKLGAPAVSFTSGARLFSVNHLGLPIISLEEWLQIPAGGHLWMWDFFRHVEQGSFSVCNVPSKEILVYTPMCAGTRGSPTRRWSPLAEVNLGPSGNVVIGRPSYEAGGFYEYKFIKRVGDAVLQSDVAVSPDFSRRLMFAADKCFGVATCVSNLVRYPNYTEYTVLRQRLPDSETQFVSIFGDVIDTGDKFQYVYRVHNAVQSDFEELLRRLGVVIRG